MQNIRLPSTRELELMSLISHQEESLYGMEIVKKSGGRFDYDAIYIMLRRLVEKGMLEADRKRKGRYSGKTRTRYRLSVVGKAVLQVPKPKEGRW